MLIVYSFNSSSQDMVWSGFTLHWYEALTEDQEIISGFILSLKVAALSACASVVLGTLAAFVLNNYRRFWGRSLFKGMVSSPLVMPEVIIGLSLLLMLVACEKTFGYPSRGLFTILFGHTVLGMAYATVVVESRLQEMSKSLSEAAMDLGCRPHQVFCAGDLAEHHASAGLGLAADVYAVARRRRSVGIPDWSRLFDHADRDFLASPPGAGSARVNAVAALTILVVSIGVVLSSLQLARVERLRQKQISVAFQASA